MTLKDDLLKQVRKDIRDEAPATPVDPEEADDTTPDWDTKCSVCGAVPTVPVTGMCGPCTFGEADTYGGNW